jgi:hypothetical protein
LDGNNKTLHTERYRVLKIILLMDLFSHLSAQASITVNHFRHALFGHDARRPCLMQ